MMQQFQFMPEIVGKFHVMPKRILLNDRILRLHNKMICKAETVSRNLVWLVCLVFKFPPTPKVERLVGL
jgi:hypothetical protein